jgi:hypothetical protein
MTSTHASAVQNKNIVSLHKFFRQAENLSPSGSIKNKTSQQIETTQRMENVIPWNTELKKDLYPLRCFSVGDLNFRIFSNFCCATA